MTGPELHHRSRACRNVLATSANDACPTTCKDVSLLAFLAFQPSLSLAPASHEAHANEASHPVVEVPSTLMFPNPVQQIQNRLPDPSVFVPQPKTDVEETCF